ncbi:hypothetical protein [Motiliproteus sediminis]|uniref:hypothetical protein n=1 Tax=Motiliproteus sediminis TaxID=1468178 RepID=UPI001AEF9FB8|nr:hypothetical protein [Motiliproteus sediminis]
MQDSQSRMNELFDGLKLLGDTAFPKQCPGCAKVFADLAQLVRETDAVNSATGLSQTDDSLTLARRCGCGSTLVEDCDERRATDALGLKRRQIFDRLLTLLTESGMPHAIAKDELLRVMRGGKSELLSNDQLARFFAS